MESDTKGKSWNLLSAALVGHAHEQSPETVTHPAALLSTGWGFRQTPPMFSRGMSAPSPTKFVPTTRETRRVNLCSHSVGIFRTYEGNQLSRHIQSSKPINDDFCSLLPVGDCLQSSLATMPLRASKRIATAFGSKVPPSSNTRFIGMFEPPSYGKGTFAATHLYRRARIRAILFWPQARHSAEFAAGTSIAAPVSTRTGAIPSPSQGAR
jgi:hypothetical protein